jgi:LytR cell envelope-related transcriptional attenuator
MSDAPEGQAERGAGRRPSRVGDSGSPVGSTLSIVLAVVAIVAGFFILRAIFDDDDDSAGGLTPSVTTVAGAETSTSSDNSTPTTEATSTTVGTVRTATVVVANASGVGGSAGRMTTALEGVGYRTGDATDATGGNLDRSVVYFVQGVNGGRQTAESVARAMGGLRVRPIPAEPPISGDLGNAGVLVMLGTDTAEKTLAELNPTSVTAPPPASGPGTTTG